MALFDEYERWTGELLLLIHGRVCTLHEIRDKMMTQKSISSNEQGIAGMTRSTREPGHRTIVTLMALGVSLRNQDGDRGMVSHELGGDSEHSSRGMHLLSRVARIVMGVA